MTLTLKSWAPSAARQPIPELNDLEHSAAGWVGSVSTTDTFAFSEFILHAKKGDLENLIKFQHFGGDLAYAVILRIRDNLWRLLVIRSPHDPQQDEHCILSLTVHANVCIKEDQRLANIKAKLRSEIEVKVRFRDIIKEWLRF